MKDQKREMNYYWKQLQLQIKVQQKYMEYGRVEG